MTEAELRAKVVELAHFLGWRVFSLPIAKTRRPVKDAVGYPDLTLARDGRTMWVELKTATGILSPDQMAWLNDLPRGSWYVVRPENIDSLAAVLR